MWVTGKKRMANLELLRCLAMMMIIVLHYLGKGKLLPDLAGDSMELTGIVAWILEAFCIVAVNVYMLISGYFLCTSNFKLSRLLQLWLQVWMYSAGVGLIATVTGIIPRAEIDTHTLLTMLFPISMGHYWFMTAYIFLYLLLPLLGVGLRKMTKGQMQVTLVLLLLVFSVTKTVLPFRLEEDGNGYDCLWYVCVFVAAAYIRRFGVRFLESKARALVLYVVLCLGIVAEAFVLRWFYLRTGSFGLILKISMEYNHLFPFLAAVGLFGLFLNSEVRGRLAGIVTKAAPYTLGVYLLHENIGLRYVWQGWLGANQITSVLGLLFGTLVAVVVVFICGVLLDAIRARVMGVLHRGLGKIGLYRAIVDKIAAVDNMFPKE